jgi:hypothetical protein
MKTSMKLLVGFSLLLPLSFFGTSQGYAADYPSSPQMGRSMNARQHALYTAMRKLWEDHITWTRLYIVAAAADSGDKEATTKRLLQNQVDIGDAIKPFYGSAAGSRLTSLLRDHILIAANIVTAAKNKDMGTVATEKARWFANADQIAVFLSSANPRNWPRAAVQKMMYDHLNLTMAEAVAELQGDYTQSVRQYDAVKNEILGMSDALSAGIIAQFPNKVR